VEGGVDVVFPQPLHWSKAWMMDGKNGMDSTPSLPTLTLSPTIMMIIPPLYARFVCFNKTVGFDVFGVKFSCF